MSERPKFKHHKVTPGRVPQFILSPEYAADCRGAEDAGGRSVRTSENIARAWSCNCNGGLRVCRGGSAGGEAPGGALS